MKLTSALSSTVLPIQWSFDIAQGRNILRHKIAYNRWPIALNARAATALTALGELILALEKSQPIPVRIATLEHAGKCGIELSAHFRLPDRKPTQWEERIRNIERVAADTKFHESENSIEITTYIWAE